jgi:predicted DNA-binding transcriptional regulator YafY
MKPSRVSRVVKLLTTLQSGKKYDATDLANLLGTSRRTVFRDLKELQAIGVPYHYDPKTSSYTINPEFFLPPLDLNLQEALSLLVLIHKVRSQTQLPFTRSCLLAGLKIENNLPPQIRQYCNTALRNISVRGAAQAPMNLLDTTFARLQEAVMKRRKVHMRYHSLFEGQLIELDLNPYHLLYNKRAWYLVGFSANHATFRVFKLSRIRQLTILDKCFVDEGDFDLDEFLGRAWSMIPEGKIYHVKLKFLPKVANNVTEVRWHTTQKVAHHSDGSATVEFRVDGLGEISWWILGYGDQVQVLAPKRLRKRIARMAKNMVRLNEGTDS